MLFRTSLWWALILLTVGLFAQDEVAMSDTDLANYEFSVLTCEPGEELYSLFGHSALRVINRRDGSDRVYNWGQFDFGDNMIVFGLKFLSGKLPYKLGVSSLSSFMREYQYFQRPVDEQKLNLTTTQKSHLLSLIEVNMRPENVYYKYDFYHDNCTTRIRDLLDQSTDVKYQEASDDRKTYRDLLHEHLGRQPWTQFGMDIILGTSSDQVIGTREQMYLPRYYRDHLDRATMGDSSIVSSTRRILTFENKRHESKTFWSPWRIVLLLLLIEIVGSFLIYISGDDGVFKWLDRIWFLLLNITGLIMLALWVFTDHSVCASNYNLLWAFPLAYLPCVLAKHQRRPWHLVTALASMVIVVGSAWLPQVLPKTAILVALITLIKCARHLGLAQWIDQIRFNKILSAGSLAVLLITCTVGLSGQSKMAGITMVAPPRPFKGDPINKLVEINANWVALVPYGVSKKGHPEVHHGSNHWWGETEQGIRRSIDLAKEHGLKVMLKPQVWIPGGWIGEMDFSRESDWHIWEESYSRYILAYAKLAAELDVDLFCIGTEYRVSVVKREAYWRALIQEVREIYPGRLTYSANWDSYMKVPLWDALDLIGISAYFPLSEAQTPPIDLLRDKWGKTVIALRDYSHKLDKKIVFTEYGYLSVNGAAGPTWELEKKVKLLPINEQAQANALQALYQVFWKEDFWAGGFLWKWFPEGMGHEGYPERDYTPQDKKALAIVSKWYAKAQTNQ